MTDKPSTEYTRADLARPQEALDVEALKREILPKVCGCENSSCELEEGAAIAIDILAATGRLNTPIPESRGAALEALEFYADPEIYKTHDAGPVELYGRVYHGSTFTPIKGDKGHRAREAPAIMKGITS